MARPSREISCGQSSIARRGKLPERSKGQFFVPDRMGDGSCLARNDSRNEFLSKKRLQMRVPGDFGVLPVGLPPDAVDFRSNVMNANSRAPEGRNQQMSKNLRRKKLFGPIESVCRGMRLVYLVFLPPIRMFCAFGGKSSVADLVDERAVADFQRFGCFSAIPLISLQRT